MNLQTLVDDVRVSGRHIVSKEEVDTGGMFPGRAIVARDPDPANPDLPYVGIALGSWNGAGARRAATEAAALEHAHRLLRDVA